MIAILFALAADVRIIWAAGLVIATTTYAWSAGTGRVVRLHAAAVRVHHELWPFALPGMVIELAQAFGRHDVLGVLAGAVGFAAWWFLRDWPDENVWKRRGRKARDAVRALGHRLVVVPT